MLKKSPATTFLFTLLVASFAGSYVWGNGADDLDTARYFGAITVFDATTDQFIRTITAIFQQIGGPLHLLLNLAGLLVTGPFLERIYGPVKYMIFFLITGIFGSLATLMFSDVNVISAGASGSVYGLMGLYLGLVLKKDQWINTDMKHWVWNLIFINLVWTFFVPGISITGHMGGLISGVVIAALFNTKQILNPNWFADFVKAAMTFTAVILCASIPKMMWPNTVLPFIQEVRIKAGLPTIYDAPNQFNDELVYNFFTSSTSPLPPPAATQSVSLNSVSNNLIEILIVLLLLVLLWFTVKRVLLGYQLKKLIKRHHKFQPAKLHKIESFFLQIGKDTVYDYQKQHGQMNKKKLYKATEFELQMYFGTIFQKIRNTLFKIVRLVIIVVSTLLILLFISIIYDNINANPNQQITQQQTQPTNTVPSTAPSNERSILIGKVIYGFANIPLESVFNHENFSALTIQQKKDHIFISGTYNYELLGFNKPSLEITLAHQYEHHYITYDVLFNGQPLQTPEPLDFMETLLSQHGETYSSFDATAEYTEDEVISYLLNFGYVPDGYSVMSHGLEGDDYLIQVFEDMDTHTATYMWYYVNQYTLDVYEMDI